jgi:hypothetical protein
MFFTHMAIVTCDLWVAKQTQMVTVLEEKRALDQFALAIKYSAVAHINSAHNFLIRTCHMAPSEFNIV